MRTTIFIGLYILAEEGRISWVVGDFLSWYGLILFPLVFLFLAFDINETVD